MSQKIEQPVREKAPGVVGPNAVIQLACAIDEHLGRRAAQKIFRDAGHEQLLTSPPSAMIDESIPARLFETLFQTLPDATARQVAEDAGQRTGRYILQNRIPRFAKILLKWLPPQLSMRLLTVAIGRNAWTFVGSGKCHTRSSNPAIIEISGNPMPTPDCVWHRAVFSALFGDLVAAEIQVRHSQYVRQGTNTSRFEIVLSPKHASAPCAEPIKAVDRA